MHRLKILPALCGLSLAALATPFQANAQIDTTVFNDDPDIVSGTLPLYPPETTSATPPNAGFNLQRTIYRYDQNADTLDIRMKFDGIAGDADGNGDPNTGTGDVANFGAGESFGIAIDAGCDLAFDFSVGVPTSGQLSGIPNEPLVIRRTTASFPFGNGLTGGAMPGMSAVLVHPPSASDPDILIRVSGWSALGRNPEQFIAFPWAETANGSDFDTSREVVNLNFSGRAFVRAEDSSNDVGLHPGDPNGRTGWDLTTTNFFYDAATDVMQIVQKFNGVAGDVDGDDDPSSSSHPFLPSTIDLPDLSGSETISIAFDFDEDGNFDTVIGVPAESNAPHFHNNSIPANLSVPIAEFDGSITNLGLSFGAPTTTGATAALAHNPSLGAPDFVVNVQNWSELTTTPFQFGYRAFAGSSVDQGYGEDNQVNTVALKGQTRERFENFTDPLDVGIPPGHPTTSGWDFTELDFTYDPRADKLTILMKFDSIAGDADGDGDPGVMTAASGGTDSPDLGNGETIEVMLDIDNDGTEDFVVGVPRNESLDTSTLRLKLSEFDPAGALGLNFGADDTSGATAYAKANPSAANPDFEIIILGWSLLDTEDPHLFGLRAFAGSFVDNGFGEDHIPNPGLPPLETELDVTLEGLAIHRDSATGKVLICFEGSEETAYSIVDLGPSIQLGTGTVIPVLTDTLDGSSDIDGTLETDFVGSGEFEFDDPTPGIRAFFQVVDPS